MEGWRAWVAAGAEDGGDGTCLTSVQPLTMDTSEGLCILLGPEQPSPSWMPADDAPPAPLGEGSPLSPAELLAHLLSARAGLGYFMEQLQRCRMLRAGGAACCDPRKALEGLAERTLHFGGW